MYYASYYIVDIDGITRVDFNDVEPDSYIMCNMEGEPCARDARIAE